MKDPGQQGALSGIKHSSRRPLNTRVKKLSEWGNRNSVMQGCLSKWNWVLTFVDLFYCVLDPFIATSVRFLKQFQNSRDSAWLW